MDEYVRENPNLAPSAIISHLKIGYGLEISYYKAWNDVQMASGMHSGDIDKSYNQLERYFVGLESTNPGSRSVLEVDKDGNGSNQFKRVFFSLHGCIKGFTDVRPMLFIDGTFLKGKYKGVLLSAVGKNDNKGLYPLAFAIVSSENIDNWGWFLEQLKLTIGDDRPLTFFSDRHIGLLDGMSRIFTNADHYYCLRHLKDNLKLKFSGGDGTKRTEIVNLLQICATSATIPLFEQNMKLLRNMGGRKIDEFMQNCTPMKWAEAYCVKLRYGETTSNAVESFNNWISDIRELPITELVDKLRLKLMKWFDGRRIKAATWKGVMCPFYQEKWNTLIHNGLSFLVVRSGFWKYEVLSAPFEYVDLGHRQCSCHEWKRTGFPCQHAVLCISRDKMPMENFVEKWFFADIYRSSYNTPINPVPSSIWRDSELINESNIKPPETSRPSGRPQNKRIPSGGEANPVAKKKKANQCGRCKKYANHNQRTCKEKLSSEV